ncbi:MAG: CHAT domain-containing protein [Candidatus Cyclobacteriaceae bacterium M2_1C_046]
MIKHILLIFSILCTSFLYAQENYREKAQEYIKGGFYDEARDILLNIPAPHTPADLSLLGEVELRLGKLDTAEEILKKALNDIEVSVSPDELLYALTLNRLALVFWNKGQDDEAQSYMIKAIDIRNEKGLVNNELLAASFNDLGLITSRMDPDQALKNYQKALVLYESTYGRINEKVAQGLINTGIIYHQKEMYGDAIKTFAEAMEIIFEIYKQAPHPTAAFIYSQMGQSHHALNNDTSAITFYYLALDEYEKIYGPKHPDIANVENLLGQVRLDLNATETALKAFQRALIANSPSFNDPYLGSYPSSGDYYSSYTLLTTLLNKARAFQQLHGNKTLKFKHLKEALRAIEKSDSILTRLKYSAKSESDKLSLNATASEIYQEAVNLCFKMGELAFKKRPYYEKAFYFAEKGKAAVLQEAITNSRAQTFAGITHEVQQKENILLSRINFLEKELAEHNNSDKQQQNRNELFDLNRQHQEMVKMMEQQYPEYYHLKYKVALPSVSKIQNIIDEETAIISYFEAENLDKLYIFLVTNNKFKVFEKPVNENFERYTIGLRNGIYFKDKGTFIMTSSYLGKLLIPHIPSSVSKLKIIPAGRLGFIPFESLINGKVKNNNFNNLPYLINDYKISYSYSINLISDNKDPQVNTSILLMAPVDFEYENTTLTTLLGTEQECQDISSTLKDQNYSVKLLLRKDANKKLLKESLNEGYDILHLATHGIVDEDEPALSRIYLNTGDDDGRLYTGEIYNLKLKTNLVTLSACQTALGKISKGEGILGFSRALLYAGAENILVSLWAVNDNSTSEFMSSFYSKINNDGYGNNLRQAKLRMIRSDNYSEPFYWAPFILIGE